MLYHHPTTCVNPLKPAIAFRKPVLVKRPHPLEWVAFIGPYTRQKHWGYNSCLSTSSGLPAYHNPCYNNRGSYVSRQTLPFSKHLVTAGSKKNEYFNRNSSRFLGHWIYLVRHHKREVQRAGTHSNHLKLYSVLLLNLPMYRGPPALLELNAWLYIPCSPASQCSPPLCATSEWGWALAIFPYNVELMALHCIW